MLLNTINIFFRRDCDATGLHEEIVNNLKDVLDHNNILVQSFQNAISEILENPGIEVIMRLTGKRSKDARIYNLPSASIPRLK